MDQADDGPANDIGNPNLGVINGIFFVESGFTIKVEKEGQGSQEEVSFKHSPAFQSIDGEIKKEIRNSDDDYIDIKDEPTTTNASAVASNLESAEERHTDRPPCHSKLKGKKTSLKVQDNIFLTTGQEKPDKAIKYGIESLQLSEEPWPDDIPDRPAHEFLPPEGTTRRDVSALQPDESCEEPVGDFIEGNDTTPMDALPPTEGQGAPKKKRHRCPICPKEFTKKCNVNSHLLVHTGEKRFVCDICKRAFAYKSVLIKHMGNHTGDKPHKCPLCSKGFNCVTDLRIHRRIHTGEKPFKCSVCPKRFSGSSYLKTHERIHTGEKPFKCSVCLKEFSDNSNLRTHKRIHTGEKPYICHVCSKAFRNNATLKSHEQTHTRKKMYVRPLSPKTEDTRIRGRPYLCFVCSKEFSDNYSLKAHERIHTGEKPYKCSVCSKEFNQISSRRQHERIHTGIKPYKCSMCPKEFSQNSNRKIHERIHTGERPFQCPLCPKAFRQVGNLTNHQQTHKEVAIIQLPNG